MVTELSPSLTAVMFMLTPAMVITPPAYVAVNVPPVMPILTTLLTSEMTFPVTFVSPVLVTVHGIKMPLFVSFST